MSTATAQSDDVKKLRDLIKGIKIAMMTTVDENGAMHSRPMGTQEAEFDGDLWFFTGKSSGKMHELAHNRQINVSYGGDNRWVSVSGTGEVVRDRKKIEELWSPIYKTWFPKGVDDPDLVLLKVNVTQAEYWDTPASKVTQLVGFVKAVTTGKPADDLGENKKVNLQ